MGSAELSDWMDYYQIEPWGAWRDNWHAAQQSALLFNVNRGKQKALSSADFMFVDPETAAENKDKEFLSFMSSRATKAE